MRAVVVNMPRRWLEEHKNSEAAQWDEMWNGVLHMPPIPNRVHQDFARDLMIYLHQWWAQPRRCRVNQEVNLTTLQTRPSGRSIIAFPTWSCSRRTAFTS